VTIDRPGSRQESPSPTNGNPSDSRSRYTVHRRRDSDTLRTAVPNAASPTLLEHRRESPPTRGYASSNRHRRSPTAPEQVTSDMIGVANGKLQRTRTAEDIKTDSEFDVNEPQPPTKTQSTKSVPNVQIVGAVGARNITVCTRKPAATRLHANGGA
jgi:hypothetical protein